MQFDLVFEGGGAKGMVFVGALQAFEEEGHSAGRLLGTSAGAITTALLAAGYSAADLLNVLGEPVLELDERMLERMDVFLFRAKPEVDDLNPDVLETEPRPLWSTPVWLAGRVAEASLGMVAEQGTNPIPVTSMGSLLLSDQSLGFASNILYDYLQIEQGMRDETSMRPHPPSGRVQPGKPIRGLPECPQR